MDDDCIRKQTLKNTRSYSCCDLMTHNRTFVERVSFYNRRQLFGLAVIFKRIKCCIGEFDTGIVNQHLFHLHFP